MIIGIAGDDGTGQASAGVGKGEAARVLVERYDFCRVSFADEIKRTVHRWWPNFTTEELWGASEFRNRPHDEYGGLTARRACQFIGTEIGRELDPDMWVRYGLAVAHAMLEGGCHYCAPEGLSYDATARAPRGVVFDDARFSNELNAIHNARGRVWKIIRPGAGLKGEAGAHKSETSLAGYDNFDAIIVNNKSLADLADIVSRIAEVTLV